jgi:hypothetical protein
MRAIMTQLYSDGSAVTSPDVVAAVAAIAAHQDAAVIFREIDDQDPEKIAPRSTRSKVASDNGEGACNDDRDGVSVHKRNLVRFANQEAIDPTRSARRTSLRG